MSDTYKVVYKGGQGEIEEKKSRFTAYVKPVNTKEEADNFIEEIKKKNWDAKHNCVAIAIGDNNEYTRCSDDGEPAGTAGKPMLEVILGMDIHNVVVVVTRYFGGILLGTGGLVRAYQAAVKEGLANSVIIEKKPGFSYRIKTDYNGIGKIKYIMDSMNIYCVDTEYAEDVIIKAIADYDDCEKFENKITEATAGKAQITRETQVYYGMADGHCITF